MYVVVVRVCWLQALLSALNVLLHSTTHYERSKISRVPRSSPSAKKDGLPQVCDFWHSGKTASPEALPRVLKALGEAGGSRSDSYWEIGTGHRGHGLPWPTLGSASAQGQSYIYSLVGATAPHSKRKNSDYIQLSPYCTLKKIYMHPPEELHPPIYSSFATISACMCGS
jgi:hypothetical protein